MLAAVVGLNMLWVSLETRPPHWDEARHLTSSLVYRDLFSSGFDWLTSYQLYPPLVYWLADLFYAAFGSTDAWVAVFSQSAFLVVLALSTYGLGRRLWSGRTGLLAAAFVVASPMLVSQFKDYMLDAPLTAMTALSLYLLVRCEEFSHRGASAALGLACGLGMLTRWNFALSLALPILVALVLAGRSAFSSRAWERAVNAVLAAAIAFAVAGPWYVSNLSRFADEATRGQSAAAQFEGDPPVASLSSFLWYGWNLVTNQLYLVPFLFFVAGVVFVVRDRSAARRNLYPLLLIGGTYVAYTLLENKDARYAEPMLPAVAVIAVFWLDRLRPRLRTLMAGGLVAYCALTFAVSSFGAGFLPKDVFLHLGKSCPFYPRSAEPCPDSRVVSGTQSFERDGRIVTERGIRVWSQNGYVDGPPSGERWHQEDIFEEASRTPGRTLWFAGPPEDFIWFNGFAMQYFARKHGVTWVAAPDQADLAAIRSRPGEAIEAPAGFAEIRRYLLPDGGSLRILTRAAAAARGPELVRPAGLEALAGELGHPVYWAGRRAGAGLELTRRGGNVFVRYLPAGARVGEERPLLTVATYPLADAFAATRSAATGGVPVPVGGGGIAFYSRERPTSVYLAYPGSEVQVEVFSPSARQARDLVASGAVTPVR
jgi:hypothetical protein